MTISPLLGIGAGLASTVLFVAAITGGPFGLLLTLFLSPLPLAIAGLGWSWSTSLVGAAVAALTLLLAFGPAPAILHLTAIGLPMAGFAYQLSLNRPAQNAAGQAGVQWYPIGWVIGAMALWAGALSAAGLIAAGGDMATLKAGVRDMLDQFVAQQRQLPEDFLNSLTPDRRDQFAELILTLLPAATATMWMLIALVNLRLGASVVAQSGRMIRPWPDFTTIMLPRVMPIGFALAAAGSFLSGIAGLVANCFVWAFALAYMLQGLAIIHQSTRGQSFRPFAIIAVYLALLFLFPPSWMMVALLGIAEPMLPFRRGEIETDAVSPPPAPPSPDPD